MYQITKHFIHWFSPHSGNNHKAKILHIDSLSVISVFLLLLIVISKSVSRQMPDILGYATDIRVNELLKYTNQERVARGLTPLVINSELSKAAYAKAQDMFKDNYWAHNSPSGKTPWVFIQDSGYEYTLAGENLAKNFNDSKGVVDAWMASPTHKENIIKSDYRDIGFAVVDGKLNGEETTLVVQEFGTTPGQLASITQNNEKNVEALNDQTAGVSDLVQNINTNTQVSKSPLINLPTATRDVALVVIGILGGVIIFDGVIIYRKKLVRISGHTVAHVAFLALMLFMMEQAFVGSIL